MRVHRRAASGSPTCANSPNAPPPWPATAGSRWRKRSGTCADEFTGNRAEGESPLADEAVNAVRVLTIHKAKGLEYPVGLPPRSWPRAASGTAETRGGCSAATVRPDRAGRRGAGRETRRPTPPPSSPGRERRHEAAEEKRLLYVAATRARERLVLVNSAVEPSTAWVKAIQEHWGYAVDKDHEADPFARLRRRSAGGTVLHRESSSRGASSDGPGGARRPRPAALAGAFREAAERRRSGRAPVANPQRRPAGRGRGHPGRGRSGEPGGAAPRPGPGGGGAVHAVLERGTSGHGSGDRGAGPADRPGARRVEFGLDPGEVEDAAAGLLPGSSARTCRRGSAGAEILGRETSHPAPGRGGRGRPRLCRPGLPAGRPGTRSRLQDRRRRSPRPAEHYRAQLADYASAVRGALGLEENPVTELILVRSGTRVETAP